MPIPNLERVTSDNRAERISLIEDVFQSVDSEQLEQLFLLFKDRQELEMDFRGWLPQSGLRIDDKLEEVDGHSVANLIAISNNGRLFLHLVHNGALRMNALLDQDDSDRITDNNGNNLLMLNLKNMHMPIANAADLTIARFLIRFGDNFRNPNGDGIGAAEICEAIIANPNHGVAFDDFYRDYVLPARAPAAILDDAMETEEEPHPNPQFAAPRSDQIARQEHQARR